MPRAASASTAGNRQATARLREREPQDDWGGRWDLHPLKRGSHSRASTTSASTTVRLEGVAPSTTRLSGKHSTAELKAGVPRGLLDLNQRPLRRPFEQRATENHPASVRVERTRKVQDGKTAPRSTRRNVEHKQSRRGRVVRVWDRRPDSNRRPLRFIDNPPSTARLQARSDTGRLALSLTELRLSCASSIARVV